jgi:hypothetical protein
VIEKERWTNERDKHTNGGDKKKERWKNIHKDIEIILNGLTNPKSCRGVRGQVCDGCQQGCRVHFVACLGKVCTHTLALGKSLEFFTICDYTLLLLSSYKLLKTFLQTS